MKDRFAEQCVLDALTKTAKKVLLCEVNLSAFAEVAGFNRTTVKKQLKTLEEEVVLKKVFCIDGDGNIQCKYFFLSSDANTPPV